MELNSNTYHLSKIFIKIVSAERENKSKVTTLDALDPIRDIVQTN